MIRIADCVALAADFLCNEQIGVRPSKKKGGEYQLLLM